MKRMVLILSLLFTVVSTQCQNGEPSSNLKDPHRANFLIVKLVNNKDLLQVGEKLCRAAMDENIFGIMLLIDSFGGDIGQFSTLHDLVKRIGAAKPVVGLVVGEASSGGYLVASATNYIFAQSGSPLGNIGCVTTIERVARQTVEQNSGKSETCEVELFTAGEFKALFCKNAPPLTESQWVYLKERVDTGYKLFLKLVSQNRGLSLESSKEWAEGRMFYGDEAKHIGLIDEVGTLFEASDKILKLIQERYPAHEFNTVELRFVQ